MCASISPSRSLVRGFLATGVRGRMVLVAVGLIAGLGAAAWSVQPADAHTIPVSEVRLVPDSETVHLELSINPFELQGFDDWDADGNGVLQPGEIEDARGAITRLLGETIRLEVDGVLVEAESTGIQGSLDSHHISYRAHYPATAREAEVRLAVQLASVTSRSHVVKVTYVHPEGAERARLTSGNATAVFGPDGPRGAASNWSWTWLLAGFGAIGLSAGMVILYRRRSGSSVPEPPGRERSSS